MKKKRELTKISSIIFINIYEICLENKRKRKGLGGYTT